MTSWRGPDKTLLFSRNDPEDPRLGELVLDQWPADARAGTEIFGWADDEGIRLNGGRPGAAEAPDRIRRFLYRMTPSVSEKALPRFVDRGNLTGGADLAEKHRLAREAVVSAFARGHSALTFGGGHDYGFPDAAAFLQSHVSAGRRPLVVNFDAHLDVRPADKSFHSGTPFRRLLEEFGGRFDFLEIGLQPQCNSRAHRDWALAQGAELWMADDVGTAERMEAALSAWLANRQGLPLWVSLDIDALTSRSAPGCSQSWDTGLESSLVFQALRRFDEATAWRGLGIYEVSPPLDDDDRTSKLAALFAHDFLTRRSRQ